MAKKTAVKEEVYAGPKRRIPSMEVKTPYPEGVKKSDVDFIGKELATLSERLNEVELSIESLRLDLKRVMGRMGL